MRIIALIIVLFSATCGLTQQFHFKNYSLEQGLSRSGVYYILQDNSGFLWVGTEGGGVCKFNGTTFKNYTRKHGLAAEDVRVIFQDDRDVIWFGTSKGLSYFNGKSIVSLTTEDGLADNYIRSITQDSEGNIWVGTNKGITIIDPDEKGVSGKLKINFTFPNMKIRSVLAQDEVVWIGTDQGLCKYKNHDIEVITTVDGLSHNLILCMYVDAANQLWVGTQDGLNKFENDSIKHWSEAEGIINQRIRSITEDNHGNLWIGTSEGISVYNGLEFFNLNHENGMSNDRVRCLTTDSFGNIWIGSYFGGIMRFNHDNFISYTTEEGIVSNQILSINEDEKGDIIVGTYDGVSKLKMHDQKVIQSKTVNLENGLKNNSVRCVYKDKDANYWYGTDRGISVIGPSGIRYLDEKNGLDNNQVKIIKYFNEAFWIGTARGLAIVKTNEDNGEFEVNFLDEDNGLAGNEVSGIQQDKAGDIWVSFLDGQLSIFEDDRLSNPALSENVEEILSMGIDSIGQIWLGTNGNGIYYGNYFKETREVQLENITTADKLVSNSIYSLLLLKDQVWAGHENGLDLISWKNDSTFEVKSFGPESGFFGMQNNQNASFKDSKGNLWFGTVDGLYCLKGEELQHFSEGTKSINYITSIKINGQSEDWSKSEWCDGISGNFGLPENLELPYHQNNISFDFIGMNFISPKNVKYRWKLEGFDKDWCAITSKNYASYTNLEPGKYVFKLQSSDEHGIIVEETIEYPFKIQKPFWLQLWFIICASLIGAILLWFIMRLRTRALLKKNSDLERVIFDRTREIRSQAEELAVKNKEVTDSIQYSRRIQGSILPGKEKLDKLLGHHFVLYKPKDIVSGDFYWLDAAVNNPKHIFFAAADCTGHGVPGAMVSLIGTRALNTSLRENHLINTNEILDCTNRIVVEAFTDFESGEIIKDGMDICLCSLDYNHENEIKFQFSGAQNPVWIVRSENDPNLIVNGLEQQPNINENGYKLFEIKGTKQPIGYFDGSKPFEVHNATLKKGDNIYLFTDGFADQFGGKKGKKFKYKTLKQLLLSKQSETMDDQKEIYRQAFRAWKGEIEQVDDICLMGVEV